MTQPLMQESPNHIMIAIHQSTNVKSSIVFHDRTRPLSKNSGHCLENHTGSHLEDEDIATSYNMVRNSNSQNSNGIIRTYQKRSSYHSTMNNLLQSRPLYPNETHSNHIDERSSDVEENIDGDNN
jgi:hypothetical protein